MSTNALPKVTRVHNGLIGSGGPKRYLLEGGDISPEWEAQLRPGRPVVCEVSVWPGSDHLGSFGGEVWPSAWPQLFDPQTGTAQSGPFTRILPAARSLFAEADRIFERESK